MLLALVVAAALMPEIAGAAPQHNPHGRFLGVVKAGRPSQRPSPQAQNQAQLAAGNLSYHGGPVMHTNRTHAIYWEPTGFTTTATYKSLINTYLGAVAADDGKHTNVYASDVQYTDGTGNAAYSSTFAGAVVATDAYPASGCSEAGTSVCLTDAQIQAEVDHVVSANGLPRGMGDLYMVMTPQGVGSCFDSGGTQCAYTYYCAYHSDFVSGGVETLYSNQPYAGNPSCDSGQHPNGDVADSTINLISHEHNEAITDPLGSAWFDASGNENGDKCAWNFGTALGSSGSGQYNQLINGHDYYLQQEWSNASRSCVLTMPNQSPTASFTFSPSSPTTGQSVSFNGSGSSDSDGTVTGYSWDFGDGATGTGATPSHPYAHAGTYTVKLTVTDNEGATGSVTHTVTVANRLPTAAFTFSPSSPTTGQSVSFDGSGSSDPDGTITGYSWTFGDGGTATGAKPFHTFATPGTYTVTLTVTDNNGGTNSVSHTVTAANRPPTASFTFSPTSPLVNQSVSFDGSGSSDPDGTVTAYSWNFGDGSTDTTSGAKPSHAYGAAGTFTVTLTVTDNTGASNQTTRSVTVGTNAPPVAAFTFSPSAPTSQQSVSFDGSGSSDSDGSVTAYAWDFGDGATDTTTGAKPSHAYAHAGTYTVKLTVTDNKGATNTVQHDVTVSDLPPTASFTPPSGPLTTGQSVPFDGSASSDPDGTISSYAWDFGDGGTGSGAMPSHPYAKAGTYTVKLTVTDNNGATNSVSHQVTIDDRPPQAAFTVTTPSPAPGQPVGFDATASSDPDGTLTAYSWAFGDGGTDTTSGAKPSHVYANPGTYTVALTVTDDSGNTNTVEHEVTVASGSATSGGGTSSGSGQAPAGSGASTPGSVAPTGLGGLPFAGARLAVPSQSVTLPRSRWSTVLLRCGAGARCTGTLTLTVTVRTTDRRGTHARTVVLGRARFSVAALHGATVRLHVARLAAALLSGHRHIRVRLTAAVTKAAVGQASVARSVWLAPAPTRR